MKRMAMAAAAMLAPAAAHGQPGAVPDTFCIELVRVIDAAGYKGGFEMLERARGTPPTLGFGRACWGDSVKWFCHQSLAPDHLSLASLAVKTWSTTPHSMTSA